jgi:hypothetical protein
MLINLSSQERGASVGLVGCFAHWHTVFFIVQLQPLNCTMHRWHTNLNPAPFLQALTYSVFHVYEVQ